MARNRSPPWPLVAVGFLLLAVPPVVLFWLGAWGALPGRPLLVPSLLLAAGAVGVLVGIRYEWWELRNVIEHGSPEHSHPVRDLVAVVAGTLVTFAGVVELGVSPIVAAGGVGMVVGVGLPSVAVATFCGAFVGMTSPALFGTYPYAAAAGVLAGLLFVAAHPVFHGVGGKLGTTAFVGVTAVVLATPRSFGTGPIPERSVIGLIVAMSVVGAVATFAVHTRSPLTPVSASGLVGAAGGGLLPLAFPASGGLLAAAVFAASFAGMSDPKRIPDERWIAVTGVGVALVFTYTIPFLGGSGGKLGTIAFGSCLGVHGALRGINLLHLRRRAYEPPAQETT